MKVGYRHELGFALHGKFVLLRAPPSISMLGNYLIVILLMALLMMLTVIGYLLPRDVDAQTKEFITLSAGRTATLEALPVWPQFPPITTTTIFPF